MLFGVVGWCVWVVDVGYGGGVGVGGRAGACGLFGCFVHDDDAHGQRYAVAQLGV